MNELPADQIQILWRSFLRGQDQSFTLIYQNYAKGLLAYGNKFNIEKDLVQDALQEIFIDIYQRRNHLNLDINNLKGYLFTALKNNLLKKIRKRQLHNDVEKDNLELRFDVEYSFQEQLIELEISAEKKIRLQQAVENLSSREKEIIFLKFEEELDYPAIAEILQITVNSARKQLYRALKSLRETIDPQSFQTFLSFFLKKTI